MGQLGPPSPASRASASSTPRQPARRCVLLQYGFITCDLRPGTTPVYRLTSAAQWQPPTCINGHHYETGTPAPVSDATTTKRMKGHPYETNAVEGNPMEGYPNKKYTQNKLGPVGLPMSEAEAVETATLLAIPEDFARKEFNGRAALGWVNGAGIAIKSWPHYLKKRWADEQGHRADRADRPHRKGAPVPPRSFDSTNYEQPV